MDRAFERLAYGSRDSTSIGVYLNYNSATGLWTLLSGDAQGALTAYSVYDVLAQYSDTSVTQLRNQVGQYIETNPDEVYDLFEQYDAKYGDVLIDIEGTAKDAAAQGKPIKPSDKPPIKPTSTDPNPNVDSQTPPTDPNPSVPNEGRTYPDLQALFAKMQQTDSRVERIQLANTAQNTLMQIREDMLGCTSRECLLHLTTLTETPVIRDRVSNYGVDQAAIDMPKRFIKAIKTMPKPCFPSTRNGKRVTIKRYLLS